MVKNGMALKIQTLRNRLRETFGNESQETVGRKLNMTQGNVSKLLSGPQQPTLDTLYRIADVYCVSVDWLLGLSDRKNALKSDVGISYALATEVVSDLIHHGAKLIENNQQHKLSVVIDDPILEKLIKKSYALSKTDWDLYQVWKSTKLSKLNDKSLLWSIAFNNNNIEFLAAEASTEAHLLEVYNEAKRIQDEYDEMMADNPGPFGE